jgi:uncharacterized membrane protein YphA (DoxX/SURF4 family)
MTTARWNASLWVAQVTLAAAFGIAGILKATQPLPELVELMVWPGDVPSLLVRLIGVAELAAAIGLILPSVTRVRPLLTPLAAVGLVLLMSFASVFHVLRGEFDALPITLTLGALAGFVAWGRHSKARPRDRRSIPRCSCASTTRARSGTRSPTTR